MTYVSWPTRPRRILGLILAAAGCTIFVACDSGPATPTAPAPPAAVTLNVTGNWLGSYRPGIGISGPGTFDLCDSPGAWIAAKFTQVGSSVAGTFTTAGPNKLSGAHFGGEVEGSRLSGTLANGKISWSATGSASDNFVTLRFTTTNCSRSTIELRRQ